MLSLSEVWKLRFVAPWSAGFSRRMRFTSRTSGAMLPGAPQSRWRTWYFSESRYSSLAKRTGVPSHSSNPL
jgi:hypothetical protein